MSFKHSYFIEEKEVDWPTVLSNVEVLLNYLEVESGQNHKLPDLVVSLGILYQDKLAQLEDNSSSLPIDNEGQPIVKPL